jgi:peptide/nickel transport system substrate-binding protein
MITELTPERIVIERFDRYWGERAPVRRAEYHVYLEAGPRITALATGELDIIGTVPIDQIGTLERMSGVNVAKPLLQNFHILAYNTNHPLMRDRRLRQALDLAIDRQLLANTLWGGQAVVPRGHQFEEFGNLYFPDFPRPEFNLERARRLLAESSYRGEVITYVDRPYVFSGEAAQAIVDMWRQIGVNAQIQGPRTVDEDMMVITWSNSMRFADPAGGLWLLWNPTSPGQQFAGAGGWAMTEEYIRVGNEMLVTMDLPRRGQLARRLMEIAAEEVPFTLLYQPIDAFGYSSRLNWEATNFHAINLRAGNISLR